MHKEVFKCPQQLLTHQNAYQYNHFPLVLEVEEFKNTVRL
jgi:hypothetical protein